ncbi:MAG: hypothetical protein K5753_04870 [Clostridia bacterium]|nr:hypothetical protein [Clostridia bacterium]
MKKALRKMIPSILMMLIAAAFVGTSTFAWFSMNRTVTVTGMSVDTRVDDNLKIATTNSEASYDIALTQNRSGHLRPVSTVNGVSFFYTGAANVNDSTGAAKAAAYTAYSEAATGNPVTNALENTNAGKTNYDVAFQTAYGIESPTTSTVVYGYIDYVFYLRATNVSGAAEDLKLTKLNLLYNGAAITTEKAWRVAVFAQSTSANTALDTAVSASDLKTILTLSDAANQTAGKAVNATDSVNTVTYGTAAVIDSIAANATEYNKVTVRLWLEGEDTTCKNDTYASLTNAYTLGLQFHIGGTETAVTAIGSVVA